MKNNKITAGTIARTIILLLALINQLLTMTGHSIIPIEDDDITELISLIWTTVAALVAWWKNNSFTSAAIEADNYMNELKNNDIEKGEEDV